jgi:hypothetical protein
LSCVSNVAVEQCFGNEGYWAFAFDDDDIVHGFEELFKVAMAGRVDNAELVDSSFVYFEVLSFLQDRNRLPTALRRVFGMLMEDSEDDAIFWRDGGVLEPAVKRSLRSIIPTEKQPPQFSRIVDDAELEVDGVAPRIMVAEGLCAYCLRKSQAFRRAMSYPDFLAKSFGLGPIEAHSKESVFSAIAKCLVDISKEDDCKISDYKYALSAVAALPGGKRVLTSGPDGMLRLWNLKSVRKPRRLRNSSYAVAVELLPDGKHVVTAEGPYGLCLRRLTDGGKLLFLPEEEFWQSHTSVVSIDNSGHKFIASDAAGVLVIWNINKNITEMRIDTHQGGVTAVAALNKLNGVASAGQDRTIALWNIETGKRVLIIDSQDDWVRTIAVLSGGNKIVSAGDDGMLRIWHMETGEKINEFLGHGSGINKVIAFMNQDIVVSAGDDGTVRLWDVSSGVELNRFTGHKDWVRSICLLPDGKHVVSVGADQTLRLWDIVRGFEVGRLRF